MIEPIKDMKAESLMKDIGDLSIKKEVLNVGSGSCKIDYHLIKDGYKVISTDYQKTNHFENIMKNYFDVLDYRLMDIFNPESFVVDSSEIVLCCEVLEHIVDYKTAFKNLLDLTDKALIVTVPFEKSFNMFGPPPIGHCNFWSDNDKNGFKNINEFKDMAGDYETTIKKIITKPEDKQRGQFVYVITIKK